MRRLLERRVVLVAGKGGVGRTSLTGALALKAARLGRRVLVAEISEPSQGYSALGRLFGHEHLSVEPRKLADGIWGCLLWSREGQGRFLHTVLPKAIPVKRVLGSRALGSFIDAAPSFNEMGVFYHMLSLLKEMNDRGGFTWDLILIDMPATGHALALTSLPEVLLRLLPDGRIADLMREGQAFMSDPRKAAAVVVTLPETLPVTEALELVQGLRDTQVPVGGIVVNRVPEDPFTSAEKQALGPLLASPELYGVPSWRRVWGSRRALERLVAARPGPLWSAPELDADQPGWIAGLSDRLSPLEAPHG